MSSKPVTFERSKSRPRSGADNACNARQWCHDVTVISDEQDHCSVVAALKEAQAGQCRENKLRKEPSVVLMKRIPEWSDTQGALARLSCSLTWRGAPSTTHIKVSSDITRSLSLWKQLYNLILMMSSWLSSLRLGHHKQKACVTNRGCGVGKMWVFSRHICSNIRCYQVALWKWSRVSRAWPTLWTERQGISASAALIWLLYVTFWKYTIKMSQDKTCIYKSVSER